MFQGMLFRANMVVVEAITRIRTSERGQGIMEYAILLGGIALVAGVALLALDFGGVGGFVDTIQNCIDFNTAGCD
jgi:hypothetical protein